MQQRAIITGISGQDGSFITQHLLQCGYDVAGITRNRASCLHKLRRFGLPAPPVLFQGDLSEDRLLRSVLYYYKPDVIFHFSGQSSVRDSIDNPSVTWSSIAECTEKLYYYILRLLPSARVVNAVSSECFGPRNGVVSSSDKLNPTSPYAKAKAYSVMATRFYRRKHGMHLSNAFLFPHESHIRDSRFLLGRLLEAALHYHLEGKVTDLSFLNTVTGQRDIGLASEYVHGLRRLAELDRPCDCVLGTGETLPLKKSMEQLVLKLGIKKLLLPYRTERFDSNIITSAPSNCSASVSEMERVLSWKPLIKGDMVIDFIASEFNIWLRSLPLNSQV